MNLKKWRTTVCYFDEEGKVISIKKIESGEYVKDKKEEHYKEENRNTVVRIINYHCKRNPQKQIIFGGLKEETKENSEG
jgi:hypothetical protein